MTRFNIKDRFSPKYFALMITLFNLFLLSILLHVSSINDRKLYWRDWLAMEIMTVQSLFYCYFFVSNYPMIIPETLFSSRLHVKILLCNPWILFTCVGGIRTLVPFGSVRCCVSGPRYILYEECTAYAVNGLLYGRI